MTAVDPIASAVHHTTPREGYEFNTYVNGYVLPEHAAVLAVLAYPENMSIEAVIERRRWLAHLNQLEGDLGAVQGTAQANAERVVTLTRDLSEANAGLRRFQRQVRDKAIEVAREHGWCKEGLNTTLTELGLETVASRWTVEVTVTATQTVEVTVDADDLDDAWPDEDAVREYVENDLEDLPLHGSDWEVTATKVDSIDEDN
jgi:hypothetical protein